MLKKNILIIILLVVALCSIVHCPAFGMGEKQEVYPNLKELSLESALKSRLPVIVKLGADWCPPCKEMKPILNELAEELKKKVIVLDLDIGKNEELAREFKITLIPTTIFYDKKGEPIFVKTGFINKDQIIEKLKELGMTK
ncbi:MAG: thioredoxin family protein [bacterium]